MDRQRIFTFAEALKQLQIAFDDLDDNFDAEATSSSELNLLLTMRNFLWSGTF